jgi:hypothetical protein
MGGIGYQEIGEMEMKYFWQALGAIVSVVLSILVLTGSIPGAVLAIWILSTWALVLIIFLFIGIVLAILK